MKTIKNMMNDIIIHRQRKTYIKHANETFYVVHAIQTFATTTNTQ